MKPIFTVAVYDGVPYERNRWEVGVFTTVKKAFKAGFDELQDLIKRDVIWERDPYQPYFVVYREYLNAVNSCDASKTFDKEGKLIGSNGTWED